MASVARREFSRPVRGESPQGRRWQESLRSTTGAYLTGVPKTSSLQRSGSYNNLRRSLAANFTGTHGMSGSKTLKSSTDLDKIEAEYIKNLQQQVYFLELEANYLREQARKATDMHPSMTAEAERMLAKLRQMQAEVDGLQLEVKRKESSLDMMGTEKERVINRLKSEEDAHTREKKLLLDEVVQLKKEKDMLERDSSRKDNQILTAREELDKGATALRNAETKMQMLRNQLDQKIDQNKITQSALEEKRAELLKTETQLREVEDKYYSSTTTIQNKVVDDLRDEVRLLHQKLKEAEMNADQDRYLRNKLSDDSSHLVRENALLNQQVLEIQKQLERERNLRESNETRRSANITELVTLKDREKQLNFELEQTQEQLRREQGRVKHYLEQLAKQEQLSTSVELNANTARSKLAELEGYHQTTESENAQLRRDKVLLVDHVAELQKQLDEKEKEILGLRSHMHSLENRLKDLEHLKDLEASLHTQKWEEFSRLAESMKTLSRSMAGTGSTTMDYA